MKKSKIRLILFTLILSILFVILSGMIFSKVNADGRLGPYYYTSRHFYCMELGVNCYSNKYNYYDGGYLYYYKPAKYLAEGYGHGTATTSSGATTEQWYFWNNLSVCTWLRTDWNGKTYETASLISNFTGSEAGDSSNGIGPFYLRHSGDSMNISVYNKDGTNVTQYVRFYTNSNCTKEVTKASDYTNGFYIKLIEDYPYETGISNIKVYVEKKESTYQVYATQYTSSNDQDLEYVYPTVYTATWTEYAEKTLTVTDAYVPGKNLTIKKVDEDTGKPLSNVQFKIYSVTQGGWVSGTGKTHTYNNSYNNATVYSTGSDGTVTIYYLKKGTYRIYEVASSTNYKVEWQGDQYDSSQGAYWSDDIVISDLDIEIAKTNRSYGELKIVKSDKVDSNKIEGAEFIFKRTGNDKDNGWITKYETNNNRPSTIEFNDKLTNSNALTSAMRFTTDANGEISLSIIPIGNYDVYEVKAGTAYYVGNTKIDCTYYMEDQDDYDSNNKWVHYAGNVQANGTIILEIKNNKRISISGYVWEDVAGGKENVYNSLWDSNEQKLQNVIVTVKNKKDGSVIATTTTNANGEYKFDYKDYKIIQIKASDYYVEFNYSTLENGKYKKYIPVAFNSTDANGSRALYDTVAKADDDLTGIVTTYTDAEDESKYGLSGALMKNLFNLSANNLENINLGIKQLPDTDYEIDENIAEVNVTMKGYTYKYVYGGKGDKSLINAPTVQWQTERYIAAYTRAIYPSDIAYDKQNGTEELKVDVTYRIDITNTEKTNIEELYQEQYLTVTELTNTFDTKRYTLKDENWTDNGDGTATASKEVLSGFKEIVNEDTKNYATTYITFSINHSALLDILDKEKNPYGIIEEFPTKATAKAYHTYTRTDYGWGYSDITKKNNEHTTTSQTRYGDAPYLILKLGETRKVKGTVFEDSIDTTNPDTENGAVLGNGQYENKEHGDEDEENVVSNVKVDLLDVDGKTISSLYNVDKNGKVITETDENGKERMPKATTTTGNDGNFVLEGMVPGEYYLRFTYADGSQKVYTPQGKEVTDLDLTKYKSTIVTSNVTKNVLQAEAGTIKDKEWTWYKYLEGTNYSVAVDDLEQKAKYNDDLQKETAERTTTSVYADTARTSITIESTKDDSIQIEVTDNGQSTGQNEKFVGFNFGIIRQPKSSATIEKVISNVKLVNSQNNVIFDGNPAKDTLTGVSDLSAESSELGSTFTRLGSTFTRIEMNENELYGSTLTITYTIRITNTSEVNYYGEQYYWFGNKEGAKEVTLSIDEISDYLDNKLVFESCNYDTEVTTDDEGGQLVRITNIGELYTEKNTDGRASDKKPTYTDVILTAKRTLSSEDDDMEFINTVYFSKLTNSGYSEPTDEDDTPPTETKIYRAIPQPEIPNESPEATVTVTPPTGEDKQSVITYTIIGIAALVVLSTGIVIIKKKIL